MEIGLTIRRLRKEKGIQQKDFAEICGISQTYLSQIEKGKKTPTIDMLGKISEKLNIPFPVLSFLSLTEDLIPEEKREMYKKAEPLINSLLEGVFL